MDVADFPFWILLGDIHGEVRGVDRIKDLEKARGIILTGDIGKNGTRKDVRNVLDFLKERNNVVFAQIGNMDSVDADAYLTECGINLHKNISELSEMVFMGLGGSLPTPFFTKSEFSEDYYTEILNTFALHRKGKPTFVISHNPPFGTVCDRLRNGRHVGSRALLNFIRDYQPDFCVCGHIHESRGRDRVGNTAVYNLGDFVSGYYGKLVLKPEPDVELCSIYN